MVTVVIVGNFRMIKAIKCTGAGPWVDSGVTVEETLVGFKDEVSFGLQMNTARVIER